MKVVRALVLDKVLAVEKAIVPIKVAVAKPLDSERNEASLEEVVAWRDCAGVAYEAAEALCSLLAELVPKEEEDADHLPRGGEAPVSVPEEEDQEGPPRILRWIRRGGKGRKGTG